MYLLKVLIADEKLLLLLKYCSTDGMTKYGEVQTKQRPLNKWRRKVLGEELFASVWIYSSCVTAIQAADAKRKFLNNL